MFGYVTASLDELNEAQKRRYRSVYCGICRCIGRLSSQAARLTLRNDCTFLALLLMSLYEPEETASQGRCLAHPLNRHLWTDNEYVRYAADMNVALACFKARDDWHDEKKLTARAMDAALSGQLARIREAYPRQCAAMVECIRELSLLEAEASADIDRCAGCFGRLMGELLVYREDLWAATLREMGDALGRFIYLADAACDFAQDEKRHRYNPYISMDCRDPKCWREHLVLTMGRCSQCFERLPLVQDKAILDNIIYSGVWTRLTFDKKEAPRDRSV